MITWIEIQFRKCICTFYTILNCFFYASIILTEYSNTVLTLFWTIKADHFLTERTYSFRILKTVKTRTTITIITYEISNYLCVIIITVTFRAYCWFTWRASCHAILLIYLIINCILITTYLKTVITFWIVIVSFVYYRLTWWTFYIIHCVLVNMRVI